MAIAVNLGCQRLSARDVRRVESFTTNRLLGGVMEPALPRLVGDTFPSAILSENGSPAEILGLHDSVRGTSAPRGGVAFLQL